MPLRHQLAAYSPLTAGSIASSALAAADGPLTELGDRLRARYVADEVVLVDSGTHALQLALDAALPRAAGQPRVAIPGFACFDIATAIVATGVRAIPYDIDPGTLGPDLDSLRTALRSGASVLLLSYLYGVPFDWEAACEIASEFGAVVVEDAAQGLGATWRGRELGGLGPISVLSFGRGKGWTGGGGGAVMSRGRSALSMSALDPAPGRLRTIVGLSAQWVLGRPAVYGLPRALPGLHLGETTYHLPSQPRRMSASSAAVVLQTEPMADAESGVRRANAAKLSEAIRVARLNPIIVPPHGVAGYLRFPVLLPSGMRSFRNPQAASRLGIAGSYPIPLEELAALRPLLDSRPGLPGAGELAAKLVTLPTHSRLSPADLDQIGAQLQGISL